jgi:hypothetical protein
MGDAEASMRRFNMIPPLRKYEFRLQREFDDIHMQPHSHFSEKQNRRASVGNNPDSTFPDLILEPITRDSMHGRGVNRELPN